MKDFNFSVINLGCNKNLVDTQFLLGKIFDLGQNNPNYNINYFSDPFNKEVNMLFINTCGFLSSGRYEILENLQKLLDKGKKVYLLGCGIKYWLDLVNTSNDKKLFDQLQKEFPDQIYILSWGDISKITLSDLLKGIKRQNIGDYTFPSINRAYTNQVYGFEYLKIAEGCNNSCSFCIIPKIRGKQKSLPIEQILQQVENMVQNGIEEIILISQDSTRYGIDIYGKPYLFELLQRLEDIKLDFVYRIMYLYPDIVSLKQLEKLQTFQKFLPYFDIPLQHISPKILKSMKRFYDTQFIYDFLEFINKNWEEKYIRTNIIVGFPGETDQDFAQLIDFIKKDFFDNIAIFGYHDEPLAPSYNFKNKLSDKIINQRVEQLKQIVNPLIDKRNIEKYKGKQILGIVMDIEDEKNIWVRPYLHAPEIDSYHKISLENIIELIDPKQTLELGDKIWYTI